MTSTCLRTLIGTYFTYFLTFRTFSDHLHLFVGQSSPSFPVLSIFSYVSCQFIFFISSRVLSSHLRLGRPLLLFPGTTMPIIFRERLSSSLLLMYPYRFNLFRLRNVDILHTLASSCMTWFLTWSFLVLPLIHRSILISATCNLFSSFFLTAQDSALDVCHRWLEDRFTTTSRVG